MNKADATERRSPSATPPRLATAEELPHPAAEPWQVRVSTCEAPLARATKGLLGVTAGTRAPAHWTAEEPAANRALATKEEPTGLIERWGDHLPNKLHCYQAFFEGGFAHGAHARSLAPAIGMTRNPQLDTYQGKVGATFLSLDKDNARVCARLNAAQYTTQVAGFADAALGGKASILSKKLHATLTHATVELVANERRTTVVWNTNGRPDEAPLHALGFTKADVSRRQPCAHSVYDVLEPPATELSQRVGR